MKRTQLRQYEMLVRIRDFGVAQADLFPASTMAREAFGMVDDAVKQVSRSAASRVMALRGSEKAKASARADLLEALHAVSRTARAISAADAAFQNKFQMPRRQPAPVLVALGRSFAEHAAPAAPLFIKRGMRTTFIADLNAFADAYESAIRRRELAKEENSESRARIHAALASGLAAAQQLDVIVANHLRDDTGMMARWKETRHVSYPKSSKGQEMPALEVSSDRAA